MKERNRFALVSGIR